MTNSNKWSFSNIPDQSGRIAIVTGANSGIGFITAGALAMAGAKVIMACRNESKGKSAIENILTKTPKADVELMQLDLSDLSSISEFVKEFKSKYKKLDLLINNAGIMMPPFGKTADGFESQFGTNHLGHFALTGQLLKIILKTPNSRIVSVSSNAHKMGKINFNNLNAEESYSKAGAYGQSKLANLLFTYELQRFFDAQDLQTKALAAHPGWTATNLQNNSTLFRFLNPRFGQKMEMGALPTLRAAVDPEAKGGDYFGPDKFMEWRGYPVLVDSNDASKDKKVAAKLWAVSEDLTDIKFDWSKK